MSTNDNGIFDLYFNLGIVVKGKASELQRILDDLKKYDVIPVYTTTSGNRLYIKEERDR